MDAFRITVRRALEIYQNVRELPSRRKTIGQHVVQRSVRYLSREDEDEDSTPGSRAEEMDASEEAREILESLTPLDTAQYDLRGLHEDLQYDVESLSQLWRSVEGIAPVQDAKVAVAEEPAVRGTKRSKGDRVHILPGYGPLFCIESCLATRGQTSGPPQATH